MGKREEKTPDKNDEKKTRIRIRGGGAKEMTVDSEENGSNKKKKEKEYTGSRWAAFWLLLLTLVAGVWFYVQGSGGIKGIQLSMPEWGGQSEWVFER